MQPYWPVVQCQPPDRQRARPVAGAPIAHTSGSIQTPTNDDDANRRQTTDASEQNNTGPLGGPVIT